jgi:hypothetical protein
MTRFHEPDLSVNPDSPFVRDVSNKPVRCGYWMDMNDRTLVMVMTQGILANLTDDEKRAHLIDLKRGHHEYRVDRSSRERIYRIRQADAKNVIRTPADLCVVVSGSSEAGRSPTTRLPDAPMGSASACDLFDFGHNRRHLGCTFQGVVRAGVAPPIPAASVVCGYNRGLWI